MSCEEIEGVLAWYANETLPAGEHRTVEAHLADCASCAEALGDLEVIGPMIAEIDGEVPAFKPTLIHEALRRIDVYERERERAAAARPLARLKRFVDASLGGLWQATPGGSQLAMAAQFCVIVALGGALLSEPDPGIPSISPNERPEVRPSIRSRGAGAAFATLSAGCAAENVACIDIKLADGAPWGDVSELLRAQRATVISGPGALGVYTLWVPVERESDVATRLEALRASELVVFAARSPN